ncbi:hypothetical protein A2U01_0060249, partial [Trifolium medium]|nr:hypothetical protein [Trifolium medium]
MARISSIIIAICIFPMFVLAMIPPVIRLPSEVIGEGKNVCAEAVASVSTWCPVKCFRTDPVCGVDGVTYWCGCAEAACAGVK